MPSGAAGKRFIDKIHGFNISVPVRKISTCCSVVEKFRATFELVWHGEYDLKEVFNCYIILS